MGFRYSVFGISNNAKMFYLKKILGMCLQSLVRAFSKVPKEKFCIETIVVKT